MAEKQRLGWHGVIVPLFALMQLPRLVIIGDGFAALLHQAA